MGIFYMDARMVSKAKQSAVAKASYISNEKLYSERDEEFKSYRTRSDKPESFILAPEHAPDWVYDREKLWNEVEKVEKNFNSQLAREIVVALPIELPKEQQSALLKEYVKDVFVADGMVADVNIHRDQLQNPHAHILLTVRPFNENGTWWEFKSKLEYILDDNGEFTYRENGDKRNRKIDLTGWNSKEKLVMWREKFAEKANDYYKKNGIEESISHLSYADQGIDKLSKNRLNRNEFYVEKQAEKTAVESGNVYEPVTYYGKLNQQIEMYNHEISVLEEEIVQLQEIKGNEKSVSTKDFAEIRKNAFINSQMHDAIHVIKKRSKTSYVDFKVAKATNGSIEFWKKSIDRKKGHLDREKKVLETAVKHFEKNSKDMYKLGFNRNNFVEEFNLRAKALDVEYKKLSGEFAQYNDLSKSNTLVYEFQKDLLRKEFVYLYPQYAVIAEIDNDVVNEVMEKYVSEFKETDIKHQGLSEFDQYDISQLKEEYVFRGAIGINIVDYRTESKQYFNLTKKVEKLEVEYKETVLQHKDQIENNAIARNEIYAASVKYLQAKKELENLTNRYEDTRNEMYKKLIDIYGAGQEEVIAKLPDRIKVSLLESYMKNESSNELKEDLMDLNWKLKEKKTEAKFDEADNDNQYFDNQQSSSKATGNLINDLIEQAKQNQDNDVSKKRPKRKRKKLTKEEIMELGER